MSQQLTQQQVQILKNEGYSDKEISEALDEVNREEQLKSGYAGAKAGTIATPSKTTPFASYSQNDNLIKWQLELNEILDRTEHMLRGDVLKIDDKGNQNWDDNPSPEDNPLNRYGVEECMRILSMYLTRNTILGNHTGEEVSDITYDFGKELNDLFFMQYELMGMDTQEKRKKYPMYVTMMVHTIWNAYTRSIGAGERSSLREARQLMQTESVMPQGMNINMNGQPQMQKRSVLNPMRYLGGKFK
jgi:DNA-binding transcriptional MerR regulator